MVTKQRVQPQITPETRSLTAIAKVSAPWAGLRADLH
jgi:hypothetical protein